MKLNDKYVKIEQDDNWFISTHTLLGVVTQGETEEGAREMLEDAVELFLDGSDCRFLLMEIIKQK